jgi:anthranilate phosphoribosyltransferase
VNAVRDVLPQLLEGRDLTEDQARAAMAAIMSGECTEAQIGAFLAATRMKGETDQEIAGFVHVMRENVLRIPCAPDGVVDTCGTGGDGVDTFNISTTAAFIAAGAGVKVAKHGNRAVSSQCGSADVLKALGVNIEAPPELVGRCVDEVGIGFLFAPLLHPAMKHAIGPRKEMGVRTVFNVLGPLTNPAGARRQLVGVFSGEFVPRVAGALARLDVEQALVVHGECGMDEISTLEPTIVAIVRGETVTRTTWTPEDFGVPRREAHDLLGGSPEESAAILRRILDGGDGACTDIALINAAAAIIVAGLADGPAEAMEQARQSVRSGAAAGKLSELVDMTSGAGP